jgi:hypothetical protein
MSRFVQSGWPPGCKHEKLAGARKVWIAKDRRRHIALAVRLVRRGRFARMAGTDGAHGDVDRTDPEDVQQASNATALSA